MQALNKNILTVSRLADVTVGSFNRADVSPGIVHFGVGNFHRCHQAVYVDELLSEGYLDWGIVGVSLRSGATRDKLAPQDYLYSQLTLDSASREAHSSCRIIGAILNILVAPENPAAVIAQLADKNIKLVTTTITEKAYCFAPESIEQSHPDFQADCASLAEPKTIYGYLAAALSMRYRHDLGPLSILCCDNIQSGGERLRAGVLALLQIHDSKALDWVSAQVSFTSSMVDRVSPATDANLKALVRSTYALEDAWPVAAEPFSQWVIEDRFAGPRPALDDVGVIFADDITVYERMKLRLLNAAHSMIAVLAYLNGQTTIHAALEQGPILEFVSKALYENLLPITTVPANCVGEDYISDVLKRFSNSALPYLAQQVNTDCSQKIQQRWFPAIDEALAASAKSGDHTGNKTNTAFLCFSLAAWVHYIEKSCAARELNDPKRDAFQKAIAMSGQDTQAGNDEDTMTQLLQLAGADGFVFFNSEAFMKGVLRDFQSLRNANLATALSVFLADH